MKGMTLEEFHAHNEKNYGSKYCVGFGEELWTPINKSRRKIHDEPTSIADYLIHLKFKIFALFFSVGVWKK